MGKVVSFDERKMRLNSKKITKGPGPIDRETYHLWQLSQDLDQIITEGILDKSLKIEEVCAVLAHRLGTLMKRSENPQKILTFCENLTKKIVADAPEEAV